MADYTEIKGNRIQYLDSDPTLTSANEGQVWYNTATGTLKGLTQIKATSSGGNTPTNLYYPGGVGPTTATLAISGVGPSPIPAHTLCSDYSGFTWTAAATIPVGSRAGYDFGTATAAVYAGGDYESGGGSPTITLRTAEYDGSAWTTTNNINGQGSFGASAGSQTAGLAFGGYNEPQSASSTVTTSYDGTSWTSLSSPASDTNTARNFTRGGGGTQTAAIFSGGSPPNEGETESWDGSSWTTLNSMNTGRNGAGFVGTQSLGIYMGGTNPGGRTSAIEEWDGTNWSISSATLSTARNGTVYSKGGSATSSLVAGGYTGTAYTTATEEYNSEINSITQAVWSSGGNYPTNINNLGSATNSTQNASLAFGGNDPLGRIDTSNEYNGSSWTAGGTMPAVYGDGMEGGTQTAAFGAGGYQPARTNATVEYNGTSWSSGGNLSAVCSQGCGTGTLTAGLVFGGEPNPSNIFKTAEYDGTSWTDVNNLNQATTGNATAFGTQTAAIRNRGINPAVSPSFSGTTESYDGTSWTTLSDSNFKGRGSGGFGTQSDGVSYGGEPAPASPILTNTEQWNGTAWDNTANLPDTASYVAGNAGLASAGLSIGGVHPITNVTREFSGQTSTVTASTLTTS